MFKLDEEFLAQLGLGDMPQEQKQAFLQHIYSELEIRVGEKLTEGMNDAQLDEFGYFVDKNEQGVRDWFSINLSDYINQPDYKLLQERMPDASEIDLMAEFGATRWLQINRPDYPEIVRQTLETIKQEIADNKDKLLGQA
ncbi:DUF5663 domain-containing protein [Candidatus Saccharibacteria bacterium]|jgi:hypothetical protein|nr:DUF5663 domain-containing protein [Candidatus Saccharibacteria bacterium]